MNIDKIFHSLPDSVKCVFHNINSHLAAIGNWHWVGIDGTEALLVDWLLTASWCNLLFVVVSNQVLANSWVNNEAWSTKYHTECMLSIGKSLKFIANLNIPCLVDVFADLSINHEITGWGDVSLWDTWKFSSNIKSKASKFTDVNTNSFAEVVVQVVDQSSPNDKHLLQINSQSQLRVTSKTKVN